MPITPSKANVLLVDDKPENLLALETVLADLGENLVRATSARDALKFLLLEDVAIILLDVQMPGLDGFELAELIRERERTQHTPIIFVTANTDNEDYKFKGYSLGAVDYLTKPIDPEILKSKVGFFSRLFLQQREIKRQANELELANNRLDTLNVDLEERVKLRTIQLEQTNRELEFEIKERRESEARLATEHAVTRTLASTDGIDAAVPGIIQTFIDHMGAAVAAMWDLSADGTFLRCSHIRSSAAEKNAVSAFVAESHRQTFSFGVGFPGHVWNVGAPIWLPNTLQGEQFPRARVAASAGIHSAVGFPIATAGEFFGIIEFYTREPLFSSPQLTSMLEAIGSEIAQFIQKKRIEEEREKLLQREKTLREEAETANRLKDEFLATVSHELRTPLNSILGWSQLVLLENIADETVSSALEIINRNARSQAQLIEDLLDASRLITGKLTLDLIPTPLIPVLEAAVDLVRPAVAKKEITLETRFEPKGVAITCDPSRLQQMVWNLITNAVKFTSPGGKVSVGYEGHGDSVSIVVSDSGMGIDPEFLPFVFDRFRQQDSSSTRKHEGLGLGLAIVKHLADLHGGSVSAASGGPGQGATFSIQLPAAVTAVWPEASSVYPADDDTLNEHPLNGVNILIVDDDEDACGMLENALRREGAEVTAANSVAEAIQALSERSADILLADINMPGEDGYSLIRKVRGLPDELTAAVAAVAVTALARTEDVERAFAAGFQAHLSKPVKLDELREIIAKLVSSRCESNIQPAAAN